MTALYRKVAECDCLVMGSPIHFDTVSSQAKLFIDRCNCIRPADFHHVDPDHYFLKLLERKRPGGIVLVGGEDGWFEGARRSIAGWFKWIEVVNEGVVMYRSIDFTKTGTAADDKTALTEARALGKALAGKIGYDYGR
jgi:multimeric flavodoxin WrbA